jgi:hypothetical protein
MPVMHYSLGYFMFYFLLLILCDVLIVCTSRCFHFDV